MQTLINNWRTQNIPLARDGEELVLLVTRKVAKRFAEKHPDLLNTEQYDTAAQQVVRDIVLACNPVMLSDVEAMTNVQSDFDHFANA
jgi:hypothetical protein